MLVMVVVFLGTGGPGNSTQLQGAANVPVDQIVLNNPSSTSVNMTSLTLSESGASASGILSATLLKNGTPISGPVAFSGSTATFTLADSIPASGSVTYTVQVNFSGTAAPGSYNFSFTAAAGNNGQAASFSGLPINGATVTLVAATATPTITSTPSATRTATPFKDDKPVLYPNPSDGGPIQVLPPPYSGVEDVTVEIFTAAFRKVSTQAFGTQTYGPLTVQLKDNWGHPLASGLYYLVVKVGPKRTVSKLLILH
jgi:hypothetical protein